MKRFKTFEGVFTPCLLSILGVIMYLRLGWVVGQVGLGWALLIIIFANAITLMTALSMSSIVTNIRIGTGGAHSIISKSLGIEAGGAIGIPLYLCQAISVAFYITGFTECWISVFPSHIPLLVSLSAWFFVLVVSYWSAKAAFRVQYAIMAVIGLSLVSVFFGGTGGSGGAPFILPVSMTTFWQVFAIFFPAVTGILAGATMSGELVDPQSSIPKGTLGAIGLSLIIYIGLAVWFAGNASAAELVSNTAILLDLAKWRNLVVAGIMGATISSALAMAVGAPRVLLALSRHAIIPFHESFSRLNRKGEPTPAIMFTALVALVTLLAGTLDSVAGLLTMFFLITYGMINLSVYIEQLIGIISFRPSFKIPRFIPLFGGLGCAVMMLLIDAPFSAVAFAVIVVIYIFLLRRQIQIHSPDVRSGFLLFLAEQFAKAAAKLPYHPKIWKPNLLVPVDDFKLFEQARSLLRAIVNPSGRILFYTMARDARAKEQQKATLEEFAQPFRDANLFVETSHVESIDPGQAHTLVTQTVRGMFFPPNTVFYLLNETPDGDAEVARRISMAEEEGLGVIVLKNHPKLGLHQEKVVNLWVRRQSPNIDLSILIALQLKKNWDAKVRIIQIVDDDLAVQDTRVYLKRLIKIMRLPEDVEIDVLIGEFKKSLQEAPPADINIFGMQENPDLQVVRETCDSVQTAVLFLRDSEHESALA